MNKLTLNKIVNQVQRSNLNKKVIPMVVKGLHLYWEKQSHALATEKATPARKKAKKKNVDVKEPVAVKKEPVKKKTAKKKAVKKTNNMSIGFKVATKESKKKG
jgi:hypothetical protein